MSNHLNWIPGALDSILKNGLLRRRQEFQPLPDGRLQVDGREMWDFASNDYLGLANDERLITAAADALKTHGFGAKASALVSGRTDLHAHLEQVLSRFEGTSSAIVFPTGMAANSGTIAALANKDDAIFSDRLNHASLIDGCRLSGAQVHIYDHDDLAGLEKMLVNASTGRKYIVTDGAFSMDGDLAPLNQLCELGDQYGAALIVDEAHATGVYGQRGRGVAELQGVESRVAVRIGTLSKAVGAFGGFVSGDQNLIDFLWNRARSQIFSTALPPSVCAAAAAGIEIIQAEPSRRHCLMAISNVFRERLATGGISVCAGAWGPIIPIVLYEPDAAMAVAERLKVTGYLVGAIRPPSVPKGTSRLRITLHANHQIEVVESLADKVIQAISR